MRCARRRSTSSSTRTGRVARAGVNASRVAHRLALSQARVESLRAERLRKEAEAAARQRRLEALAAQVAPEVPDDPARVRAETAAAAAYKESVANGGDRETGTRIFATTAAAHHGGYTMDALMAHTRHRLAVALHEAGLGGTGAARDALMQVQGSLLPRKDTFTSAQLSLVPGAAFAGLT